MLSFTGLLFPNLVFPRTTSTPHSPPPPIYDFAHVPPPSGTDAAPQAAGAGTERKSSPHTHSTSASSNSLSALPTGGIMGPPAAQVNRCRRGWRWAEVRGKGVLRCITVVVARPNATLLARGPHGRGVNQGGRCHDVKGIKSRARTSPRSRESRTGGCRSYDRQCPLLSCRVKSF